MKEFFTSQAWLVPYLAGLFFVLFIAIFISISY